jgi:hypothetical protein
MSAARKSHRCSSTSVVSAVRKNKLSSHARFALKALVRLALTFACSTSYFALAQDNQLPHSSAQGAVGSALQMEALAEPSVLAGNPWMAATMSHDYQPLRLRADWPGLVRHLGRQHGEAVHCDDKRLDTARGHPGRHGGTISTA